MKIIKRNKSKSDCGVVAATNAAEWYNLGKSYKEVEKIARSCGYGQNGIYFFQFVNLFKKLNIPVKRVFPKSSADLANRLRKGKFFVLLYTPTDPDQTGHAIAAFMDHLGIIRIINPGEFRTWKGFMTDIRDHGLRDFVAWEIPNRVQK